MFQCPSPGPSYRLNDSDNDNDHDHDHTTTTMTTRLGGQCTTTTTITITTTTIGPLGVPTVHRMNRMYGTVIRVPYTGPVDIWSCDYRNRHTAGSQPYFAVL